MRDIETSTDSTVHVNQIRDELIELVTHLRTDIHKIADPKAVALFETSAEVLTGLERAFEHYAKKTEAAWQK